MVRTRLLIAALAAVLLAPALAAQEDGQITGRITQEDGKGVAGATVVVNELGAVEISDTDGGFRFDDVPAGTYSVTFSLGNDADTVSDVVVEAGADTRLDQVVGWELSFAETITVYSASRRRERIVEAPAAVTSIPEEQIERESTHGQLPKLLEFSPGVEVAQSGIFDFNLNTRGFNSSINRRVVVLIDGRDPAVPFLGAQEWVITSQYLTDLASAEMVRGPSSALYGANAYNGVLNLVTKAPRLSQGGEIRVGGGELSTLKANGRWATELGNDWYLKLTGAFYESDDWSEDRVSSVEYPGLPPEAIPRPVTDNEINFGNVRIDKNLPNGDFFTLEGGAADAQGPALQTAIGRFSVKDLDRTWARANYTARHFNLLAYYNEREGDQDNLASGAETLLDSSNWHVEAQTNWDFADGKVRLVAGGSYSEEEIDSKNDQGFQTLVFEPVDADFQAVFAQVDFDLTDSLKLVLAGRWDDSSLHDDQVSPKAALVWAINPNHSIRVAYNEAFQVPNYSEYFLYAMVGQVPGSLLDFLVCGQFGLSCGLDPLIPVVAAGNTTLELEEVESWEVGYTGIIGSKAYVTIDYYNSELTNFITDPLPQLGTSLGQINPLFQDYQAPGVPSPINDALLLTIAGLTGGGQLTFAPDGSQVVVARSYANFGAVDTQGIDLGFSYYATPDWQINGSYSWFDFDIQEELPDEPLLPNAPENQASFGVAYVGDAFDAALNVRWVEEFQWAAGIFVGEIPSYETVDLTANYRVTDSIELGVNVSNLLDDEHWETFGGDVIGRRAIGTISFNW